MIRGYWWFIPVLVLVIIVLQGVRIHPGVLELLVGNYDEEVLLGAASLPPKLPSQIHHRLPFVSQAPRGQWRDDTFQNACEEASMYMVKLYYDRVMIPPLPVVSSEALAKIVAYEREQGIFKSMSVDDVQRLFQEVYQIDTSVIIHDPSLDAMKMYLQSGVLLLPVSGEILANPHFSRPFPPYHMIVVIGYDDTTGEFITHDPGTKFGENFRYSYATIMDAIHDWTGSAATILSGPKRVVYVPLR